MNYIPQIYKAITAFIVPAVLLAVKPLGITPTTTFEEGFTILLTAALTGFMVWLVPNYNYPSK